MTRYAAGRMCGDTVRGGEKRVCCFSGSIRYVRSVAEMMY